MTIADIESQFTSVDHTGSASFTEIEQALEIYQRNACEVYQRFGQKYLPISAFKYAEIATFPVSEAECVFLSSSTGEGPRSRHYVFRKAVYEASVCSTFESVFGAGPFTIWVHLPGYVSESSLVCMMKILIRRYGDARSQFFLADERPSTANIGSRLILFGAAFGLLDLAETGSWQLPSDTRIVETGGMKTHRREISRRELHHRLADGFGVDEQLVWSEYGMCELLSQAYAQGGPVYTPPPWMRVQVVDPHVPESALPEGEPGLLAITDLANMYSVSNILTEDMGVSHGDGFEVLGRFPGSALRGCNFLLNN